MNTELPVDPELDHWRSLWHTDAQIPDDLQQRARRQIRRMRMMLAGDIAVTVVMGGGATVWALNSDRPSVRLLTAWVWFTILIAWLFRYFNNRGNWTGLAPSTDAFFEAWVKRCRETQRNLIFGIGLGMVQLLVCSAWVNRELHRTQGTTFRQLVTSTPMLIAWLCAASLLGCAIWLSRKVRAEWIYAQRLRDEWAQGEPDTGASPQKPAPVRNPRFLDGIALFQESLESRLRRRRNRVWKL